MNLQAMRHIRDTYQGPSKFLLMVMATYARPDGTGICVSVGTLADKVGMSDRFVRYQIDGLVAAGVLDRAKSEAAASAAAPVKEFEAPPLSSLGSGKSVTEEASSLSEDQTAFLDDIKNL